MEQNRLKFYRKERLSSLVILKISWLDIIVYNLYDLFKTIKVIIMASEITLKYLHPSIKTYITTENYNYDTSVAR